MELEGAAVDLEVIMQDMLVSGAVVRVTEVITKLIMVDMNTKVMEYTDTQSMYHITHMIVFTIPFITIVCIILCTMFIMITIMLFTMFTILHIQFNMIMVIMVTIVVVVVVTEEAMVVEGTRYLTLGLKRLMVITYKMTKMKSVIA